MVAGGLLVQDVERDNRCAAACGRLQRRLIAEPEVLAEPDDGGTWSHPVVAVPTSGHPVRIFDALQDGVSVPAPSRWFVEDVL
jgi:hypothetical protein